MTVTAAIEQAMVARDTVMGMVEERQERIKAVGQDGWMQELTEEAIRGLKQVGVSEEEARKDLALDLAEEDEPLVFLEILVGEIRTVTKLGKMGEVAEKMKQAEEEEKNGQ